MEIDPTANLPIKIVTVGDKLVGKSCAIQAFQCYHSVSLPLMPRLNVIRPYLTVHHVRFKLMDPSTTSLCGNFGTIQGHNRKPELLRSNQVMLQRCSDLFHLFFCHRS